jgi:hypothetical protein
MSEELGLQIIIITGETESPELLSEAGRIFRLENINGITKVEMEDNPI